MADYRRILIIKPSSMGDIVHTLPTLRVLRERFADAHIAWFVKRQWADLVERADGLDEVWPVKPGFGNWLAQIRRVREVGFDLAIDLQGLFRSSVLAWLAGCATRIGFANAREASPFFYTHRVPVPNSDLHAVDRYLLIAEALGAPVQGTPEFRFRGFPADREEVEKLLGHHGVTAGAPWIAMNVSARWPTKRWPPEFFARTADRLQHEGLGPVALIGGPDDSAVANAVKRQMRTTPVDLTGKTAPGLLPTLLKSAQLLLTNDSGPMHIAAAVGTPVVALFGPTSPLRTGPYGHHKRVLMHKLPCSPCFSRTCRNTVQLECLESISPDTVVEAVRERLALRVAH